MPAHTKNDTEEFLHEETYKGYSLRIVGTYYEWVCSALMPETNIWEDILFIDSEEGNPIEDAIEDFRAEVDQWDAYPGH